MSTLEGRIRRLEDEGAILNLLYTYGRALDEGLEDEFSDCWTEEAVLIWGVSPHRPDLPFTERRFDGRKAIVQAFRAHTHSPEFLHRHLLYAPMIRVEGDRATAQSTFERHDESADGPIVRSFGRYVDSLERGADGCWRLTSRRAEVESSVPAPARTASR